MKLIARQPCCFGGRKFFIGNEIPTELVLNPKAQEGLGVLTIVEDGAASIVPLNPSAPTISVLIRADEGDMPLILSVDGIQAVVDVLTSKVEDAGPIIADMTDGDALILLHLTDSRKAVKAAAEERAKAISPETSEESEGEQ